MDECSQFIITMRHQSGSGLLFALHAVVQGLPDALQGLVDGLTSATLTSGE